MSARTFNRQFRPQDFKGPLASHYPDREDLFQQVGGDLLRELFRERVCVAPTKGRDGAIDTFIEEAYDSDDLFYGLRFPIIVECKDHDDTLGTTTRNVEAGWQKVQEKLERHAEKGWEGAYQPWGRAKGYLYCVSAVLHQQARDKLTQSIADFFSSLPPKHKPAIRNVHVLDWGDLAALLNHHPRLADAWLGIDLSGIVGHEAYKAGLSGFRLYLKEENLSLISPGQDDPTHPQKLLATVQANASSTGILVVGPGGVGKTRICFEVARLASGAGWRVLHLLPGEPSVTATALQEVVLQGSTPTLLVIDYLDQMGSLDFGTIRHRLIPETQARGIPVALLANARPGVLHKTNPERDSLFQRIELDIRDRRARIATHFQETIAPRASIILGAERVRQICGRRPIIGMFIARELERYASEDSLDEKVVSRLRQGDLQGWMRRRFQEDGLLPQETHPLLPASPDRVMLATAAGFAAAPLSRPEMFGLISATLAATKMEDPAATAGPLITSLERSGWLEQSGYVLTTPHDVVSDELLELTLCDRDLGTVRVGVVDKILVGVSGKAARFGRFSVALDRVMGQKDFPEQMLEGIKEGVSRWVALHATEMGQTFTTVDADEVSYALGAVLTGSAWNEAALKEWDSLIAPWLALNARSGEARHLLYRGLKALPEGAAASLAEQAMHWLEGHGLSLEASYIIDPLLSRSDLGSDAGVAVKAALAWLEKHETDAVAQFVLPPLLSRSDLGSDAGVAVKAALAWLEKHETDAVAQFVLNPLLSRSDLGSDAGVAVKAALAWLEKHETDAVAQFVLPPLSLPLRPGLRRGVAVKAALAWLEKHETDAVAQFVLNPLLSRSDLGTDAGVAVKAALDWLEKHGTDPDAGFVLPPLLGRADLGDHAQPALKAAMDWLQKHETDAVAQFVLNPLLSRSDLGTDAGVAVKAALDWLEKHGTDPDAGFVLPPLLGRADLGDHAQPALKAAMDWLQKHETDAVAQFVLNPLLSRSDLGTDAGVAVKAALDWLEKHGTDPDAGFVLPPLLGRADLGDHPQPALKAAMDWLQKHETDAVAQFVLNPLLSRSDLGTDAGVAVKAALDWLEKHGTDPDAGFVLLPLLGRADLGDHAQPALKAAMDWLEFYFLTQDAEFVLKNLLARIIYPMRGRNGVSPSRSTVWTRSSKLPKPPFCCDLA